FHIPGRAAISGDTDTSTHSATIDAGRTILKYEVEDTVDGSGATTNMGVWEDQNEIYPNTDDYDSSTLGGLDLRGKNVRHHSFPTIHHIFDNEAGVTWKDTVPVLGIDVANCIVPTHLQSKIKAVRIYFVERNLQNSLILGQGLLLHGGQ